MQGIERLGDQGQDPPRAVAPSKKKKKRKKKKNKKKKKKKKISRCGCMYHKVISTVLRHNYLLRFIGG